MNILMYQKRLDTIINLAKNKNTGRPTDLASRLDISERTLRRMVSNIKDLNIQIMYSRSETSYVIEES